MEPEQKLDRKIIFYKKKQISNIKELIFYLIKSRAGVCKNR